MAELLIFTQDIQGATVFHTCKLPKRGHVITVQPDGWNWGKEELTNPLFRIWKFPGQPVQNYTNLLTWEAPTQQGMDLLSLTNTLQMRGFKLNIDSPTLPAVVSAYIADDTRQQPTLTPVLGGVGPTALTTLTVQVAPVANPAVIGSNPAVIG